MVVVPKSKNRVRICVDLTRCVKRERHPLPGVDQTLAQLAGVKLFTKLDANSGFWQIPLSPDSALLTTFITPFGGDFIVKNLPASEQQLKEIKECQEADPVCQQMVELCLSGWPAKQSLPAELKPYHTVSAELAVENGLLLRGSRIFIPPPLRRELLNRIHSGHQGITKCRELARKSAWWPGLSKQLKNLIQKCEKCLKVQH